MTRTTNARLAGFTFLFYIGAGIAALVLFRRASAGDGVEERLASLAQHPLLTGGTLLLDLAQCFAALILGVTLYALTRDVDRDLALLALAARFAEGMVVAAGIAKTRTLLWIATAGLGAPSGAAAQPLAASLFHGDPTLAAILFAAGSTLFCWLFLAGRWVPRSLAWLGLVASLLLLAGLPLQLAGWVRTPWMMMLWLPMLAFEVPFALWLLLRSGAPTARP